MSALTIPRTDPSAHPAHTTGAALLHALARAEAAGRLPERLTEPGHATWSRFKGRLGPEHLLQLLAEDAAVLRPIPFDADAILDDRPGLDHLSSKTVRDWLAELAAIDLTEAADDYLADQARLLGIPSRMARSDLHKVKPHQKVLELPGTGGQLAHWIATHNDDVYLQDNVVIACDAWNEKVLAGLVAWELNAPHTDFIRLDPELEWAGDDARRTGFDFVVGLHPDKGGRYVAERLQIRFPNATVLLV